MNESTGCGGSAVAGSSERPAESSAEIIIAEEAAGEPVRLQKLLASAGVASRRKCEELITAGRVRVNGEVVLELGAKAPRSARIEVDGRQIAAPVGLFYILLNKPTNCVTTASDPQGRRTVLDAVRAARPCCGVCGARGTCVDCDAAAGHAMHRGVLPDIRLFPVGRLDFNTTGLLLLTNDGDFAHATTHPGKEVAKVYEATLEAEPGAEALDAIRSGVTLEDGFRCAPADVEPALSRTDANRPVVTVTIHEGRNRQVRRMFEAVGLSVVRLRRAAIGAIDLRKEPYARLPLGSWAPLSLSEAQKALGTVQK